VSARRVLAWVAFTLAGVLVIASPVLFGLAIWTTGPDSMRLSGTGFLCLLVGSLIGLFSSFVLSLEDK